jgi:hypothetical protein
MTSRFEFVPDSDLREAVELRISSCFPAMNMANAIGGTEDLTWKLVRNSTLIELIEECLNRKMPIFDFKGAVDHTPFKETKAFQHLKPIIDGKIEDE